MALEQWAREEFFYDPETGIIHSENYAGYLNSNGYWRYEKMVSGAKLRIYAHQLAWLLHTGSLPNGEIDHVDGNPLNNKIENLRLSDRFGNTQNTRQRRHSSQPYKGVRSVHGGRWAARITANRKYVHLGTFDTPEDAYAAYCCAAQSMHGEFARIT